MNRKTRDWADAGIGLLLLAAAPASFVWALATGEWRWGIITAASVVMLAMKQ